MKWSGVAKRRIYASDLQVRQGRPVGEHFTIQPLRVMTHLEEQE
ncbi:MAG: hypothetical protein WB699_14655 [Bacteroidota bacterium]